MSEQNIDITLKTLGADAAAAEIKKVEEAEKGLNKASTGFGGQLESKPRAPEIQAEASAQRSLNTAKEQEVKTIFKNIEGTRAQAEMESDLAEVLRRRATATAEATAEAEKMAKVGKFIDSAGLRTELEMAKTISKSFGVEITAQALADTAVVGTAVTAVAAAGVLAAKSVTASVDDYDAAMIKLEQVTGKSSREGADAVGGLARAVATSTHALEGFLGKVGEYGGKVVEVLIHPVNTLRDIRKWLDGTADLEKGIKRAEDALKAFENMKQERAEAAQVNLQEIYKLENDKLLEQERTLNRITELRGKLDSAERQRASLAVADAKRSGGDVALAEANQIAVDLAAELNQLKGSLIQTQVDAQQAQTTAQSARNQYEQAVRDNVNPTEIARLDTAMQVADTAAKTATEKLQDHTAVFNAEKANILEEAQGSLLDLANDSQTAISKGAEQAIKGVEESLKNELGAAPADLGAKVKTQLAEVNEKAAATVQTDFSATATEQSKTLTEQLKATSTEQTAVVSANMSILIGQVQTHTASTSLTVTEILTLYKSSQTEMNKLLKTAGEISRESNRLTRSVQADQTGVLGALEQMVNTQKAISSRLERLENRR